MPPLVLKLQQEDPFNFSNLNQDELSKTWRVCTKVKDSLENGSRLENLSWRLWFRQNVTFTQEAKRKKEAEEQARKVLEQQANLNQFTLNQFTSDQANDQMIQLNDIFSSFDPAFFDRPYDPNYYPYPDPLPIMDNSIFDIPNVTLYNKMLASLPKETLASAERLLTPQPTAIEKEKKPPTHYYSTFKVSPLKRKNISSNPKTTASSNSTTTTTTTDGQHQDVCNNCQTVSTPFWRKSEDQVLCNACGL
ncbi:unnamed protein product [Rhizopus stolonifer]